MPVISVPPPYQGPTHGKGELPVVGASVRTCLEAAEAEFPGLWTQLFDTAGRLHRFVKLFVNDEQIDASGLDDPIEASDTITIVTAIAGG